MRELCRYPHIEHIDLVEIDERVVEVCKQFLPTVACSLDDPRVHILYQDGLKYIRRIEDEYDLIIIDSTDPFGPARACSRWSSTATATRRSKSTGVLVNQHESPFYKGDALACQRAHRNIVHSFELSRLFQAHIPTYPSGHWLFGFSSRGVHPVRDLDADAWNARGIETKYYNTNLAQGRVLPAQLCAEAARKSRGVTHRPALPPLWGEPRPSCCPETSGRRNRLCNAPCARSAP